MSATASPGPDTSVQALLDKHRPALDEAMAALRGRGYYSRYPESPSPRVYGEDAAQSGRDAFDAHLAFEGRPVNDESRERVVGKLAGLAAFVVREETEAALVEEFQQHDPRRRPVSE
jgi:hypothetical protein